MRKTLAFSAFLAASVLATAVFAQSPALNAAGVVSPVTAWRASKLIGVNVYNEQNDKLGDINEILLDHSGKVAGVILGVGGFLGMGERDVLVNMSQLKFVDEPVRVSTTTAPRTVSTDTNSSAVVGNPAAPAAIPQGSANAPARPVRLSNEKWYPDHAVLNATKDQLKAMAEFKYGN